MVLAELAVSLYVSVQSLCLLQVQDLTKVYTTRKGDFLAADQISLDIPAGKMTALLGPSGSGRHARRLVDSTTDLVTDKHTVSMPHLAAVTEQNACCRQDNSAAAHSRLGGAF